MPLPADDLAALTDAALGAAGGCSAAELRVERIRSQTVRLHDADTEGVSDETEFGLGVRVVIDGAVGFAASVDVRPEEAATLVGRAIEMARVTAAAGGGRVELAPEPADGDVVWSSAFDIDPSSVPLAEKVALLTAWSERLLAHEGVSHTTASVLSVSEETYLADLNGTRATQHRVRLHPQVEALALSDESGFETMRTLAPPVGRGWEYLLGGHGWDWEAELAQLPELLAEKLAAPSVEAGDYDLVVDPSNLWLTIHESIGHATELDRAVGFEAAYAGTSFATFDQLDSLVYGSGVMHVTGDRTIEHGLATVAIDGEGVAAQSFDLVAGGILVGYQLDRAIAARMGFERSNGCAFADSPLHVPIQRMANVSLAHSGAAGPSTEELIAGVDRGVFIVGDKSWSIDMQRYNFQFTGQRFYAIRDGRLAGQLRDVAYQATTTDFWGAMEAVGGEATWVLGGAFNCGKGQPGQVAPVSHGCPSVLVRGVRVLNARAEGDADRMIEPQAIVEASLAAASAAGCDGCVVLVDETSHTDVRFALNTTTTNGVRRDRSVTVVVMAGQSVGAARQSGAVDVAQMVSAALTDARGAPPADDAFALVDGLGAARAGAAAIAFGAAPAETDLSVLHGVLSGLGGAFERARHRDAVLAGFAEYGISTVYLGSSTGVRLSFAQPTGAVNLVGRTADGSGSAWTGAPTIDPAFGEMEEEIWRRLDWSTRAIPLEAGRYEVIMPPSGVADLMGMLYFYGCGGQDGEDGRTVFSAEGGGTRLGDQLSTIPFTLYSDPAEAGVECTPFVAAGSSSSETSVFDNGLPLGRTDWVREGRLAQLRYHRAGAARSGVTVAPFIDNLVLRAGSGEGGGTVDDMVARTERGLLLTCLWYIREVDPATLLMTGLTRDGVYVIEDGVVVGAANNFRFNESPVDLLTRATEVGTPVRSFGRELGEYLNRTIMPPLRLPGFNMSSVSQAS